MSTKTCSKCKTVKALDFFGKDKSKKDGLTWQCRQCQKVYREDNREKRSSYDKAYHEANKEKVLSSRKAYKQTNPEKVAAWLEGYLKVNKKIIASKGKIYREDNKENASTKQKEWREANKEKVAATGKNYREANKEKRAVYGKAYNETNKVWISSKNKIYRESNLVEIAARAKIYNEANKVELSAKTKTYNAARQQQKLTEWADLVTSGLVDCYYTDNPSHADKHAVYVQVSPSHPEIVKVGCTQIGVLNRSEKLNEARYFGADDWQPVAALIVPEGEAFAIEYGIHAELKARGLWLDPAEHGGSELELFFTTADDVKELFKEVAA